MSTVESIASIEQLFEYSAESLEGLVVSILLLLGEEKLRNSVSMAVEFVLVYLLFRFADKVDDELSVSVVELTGEPSIEVKRENIFFVNGKNY